MATRTGTVHVVTTKRTYKGKVYTTHLLRRGYREGGKVKNETLGNISHLPDELITLIKRALRGEQFVALSDRMENTASFLHGHVDAVLRAMQRLGFENLIASRPSRERNLVVAMIAARILSPESKLATTRWWQPTTLPELLDIQDATEDDCYAAMDWLLARQDRIERKLADRHLAEGGLVLYDLSSSYVEGRCCPLATLGHNRDGKKGKLQINYGLLTDRRGCPVSISVFEGNTGDPTTLLPQVAKIRNEFGINEMVLVGDRGMISQKQIKELQEFEGISWITALKTGAIRALVEGGALQLGLFDERNLFEFTHPDYPGERLVACRNPELRTHRAATRQSMIEATQAELRKVQAMVSAGRLKGQDKIGLRVGKVINKYKMQKHFVTIIEETAFAFQLVQEDVDREAALDGIYVLRTPLSQQRLDSADIVRTYKGLSAVERAFRSMKTIDLKVRPIYHHLTDRVRAHVFLCMLAYYVEWHLREAWRPLLFADEDLEAKASRDPVAPAKRSRSALRKIATKRLDDGTEVHSFHSLLHLLSSIVQNVYRVPGSASVPFRMNTTPDEKQQHALDLLATISL